MNDQLHCGHICAAAFLAFSGQLRTTSAEDFHKRGGGAEKRGREGNRRGERKRESTMSAEDNALNKTFRELGLSKQRGKTEKIEISM